MDIREYCVKELPYHFVLFYGIDEKQLMLIKLAFHGKEKDNAVLTYCYLDTQCGLSYKVICCAQITEERVFFTPVEAHEMGYTVREGGLIGEAIIIDEGGGVEEFQEEADFIKKCYGYHLEALKIDEDDPFSAFRHPAYPKDIMTVFLMDDGSAEKIWVTELEKSEDGGIKARLLNEPYNSLMGVHEGEIIKVVTLDFGDGSIVPAAILPWMYDKGIADGLVGISAFNVTDMISELEKRLNN